MRRPGYWFMHLSLALVTGTGLAYGWMRYFMQPVDKYAVVNHPWQPALQHLHIVFAPALVLALGHLWYEHAWTSWKGGGREGRLSGIWQLLLAIPMIFSGYLLQVSVSSTWRFAWAWAHVVTSVLWVLGYAAHFAVHVITRRRDRVHGRKQ